MTPGLTSTPGPITPCPPWLAGISVGLLAAAALFLLLAAPAADSIGQLRYPGESAGRMVERHLEFYEGYERTPPWERALHTVLFGSRESVEDKAIAVYREVLAYYASHPQEATPWAVLNTRTRLLVTLAETRRTQELEQALAELDMTPEEEVIVEAIRYAYDAQVDEPPSPAIVTGASLLPLGWASDHLRLRIAEKAGNRLRMQFIQSRLLDHAQRWRERVLGLTVAVAGVVILGLTLLLRGALRRPSPWRAGALETPWSFSAGVTVFVWSALLGLVVSTLLAFYAGPYFHPGVLALWGTLFASLPMLVLTHRYLLCPRGLGFASAFGLSLRGVGLGRLAAIVLGLMALEFGGTLIIAWAGWQAGLESHWSQGLYERLIFGPWQTTVLSGVNLVLWAPIFEELGFRGLVYVTLRARLRPVPAALLSAALFASLHLYSLPGFLSVFWSGLILAFAFERFRSLLPGMLVHGAANLLSLSTVLLFYR